MKLKIYVILGLLFLLPQVEIKAQSAKVSIQSFLTPVGSPPTYYSDLLEQNGLVNLQIRNLTAQKLSIRFRMKLDGHNGISLHLSQYVQPSRPLELQPSETRFITQDELMDMYSGLSQNDIEINGLKVAELLQSQKIADGVYELCVQAFDNLTLEELSPAFPSGCSNQMMVTSVQPPSILQPYNKQELSQSDPQFININWTPVMAPSAQITYTLRMVPVQEGLSAHEAMNTTKFNFFEVKDLQTTFYNYSVQAPYLEAGRTYAIQVEAVDESGQVHIENDGKSEVVSFVYKAANKNTGNSQIYACGDACTPPEAADNQTDIDDLRRHDMIRIGHFQMLIDDHRKSGNTYEGTGMIYPQGFFHAPIFVNYRDLKVNDQREAYEGVVTAGQKQEYLELECVNATGKVVGINNTRTAKDVFDLLVDPASAITGDVNEVISPAEGISVHLPLAFGNNQRKTIIVGMELTPQGATMDLIHGYAMHGDHIEQVKYFIFGADDICVTPGGVTTGQLNTRLALLHDVDYSPNSYYDLHFSSANDARTSGCFVEFNCEGIQRIDVGGQVALNRDYVLPLDNNGNYIADKRMAAGFQSSSLSWTDLVFQLDFTQTSAKASQVVTNRFEIVGMEGFHITLNNAWMDRSPNQNPVNMEFPPNHAGSRDADWEGIYLKDFSMRLPEYMQKEDESMLTLLGNHILYDEFGFTGEIGTTNLLSSGNPGKLGAWDFTMEEFLLRFVQSDLESGVMKGRIRMEISSTPVAYEAEIKVEDNKTVFDFEISPQDTLNVPMWGAKIKLDPSSSFNLNIDDGNPTLSANLNGHLSLNSSIDVVDQIEISGVYFEKLEVSSNSPYIHGGDFHPETQLQQKIGGFKAGISKISVEEDTYDEHPTTALKLDLDLDFCEGEDENAIAGRTRLNIHARKNQRSNEWDLAGSNVEAIQLESRTSSVTLNGRLNWFNGDEEYGNGFSGGVNAKIMGKFGIDAEATYGHVDGYNYWSVGGAMDLVKPVPLVGVFALKSFGGGAYYNMKPNTLRFADEVNSLEPSYTPEKNGWGLRAMAGISTTDGYFMNGKFSLNAAFTGASLSSLRLEGDAYLLQSGTSTDDNMIQLKGVNTYNNDLNVLDGQLGYKVQILPDAKLIWSEDRLRDSVISMHFSKEYWNVFVGKPDDQLKLQMGFDVAYFGKVTIAEVGSYFCLGQRLPELPSLPGEVSGLLGPQNLAQSFGNASGVMSGVHGHFGLPKKKSFSVMGCGVKIKAGVYFGMDMAIRHLPSVTCQGRDGFGINKWYGSARGYMYGDFGLYGEILYKEIDLIGVKFGTAMKVELPNPTYMSGTIGTEVDLPIYGSYTVRQRFRVGEKCVQEMDDEFIETFVAENLSEEEIIKDLYIDAQVDSLNPFSPEGKVRIETYEHGTRKIDIGGGHFIYTKLIYTISIKEAGASESLVDSYTFEAGSTSKQSSPLRYTASQNPHSIFLKNGRNNPILDERKNYFLRLFVKKQYKVDKGEWQDLRDAEGKLSSDRRTLRIRTATDKVKSVQNMIHTLPAEGQRNFYEGDFAGQKGEMQWESRRLINRWGRFKSRPWVRFTDTRTGELLWADADFKRTAEGIEQYENHVEYDLPDMNSNTIYKVDLMIMRDGQKRNSDGSNMDVLYTYYFRTSYYNTLDEKLEDMKISIECINPGMEMKSYKLTFKSAEKFTRSEGFPVVSYLQNVVAQSGNNTSWQNYYNDVKSYAQRHGVDENSAFQEMMVNENESGFLPEYNAFNVQSAIFLQNMHSQLARPSETVLVYTWYPNVHLSTLRNQILAQAQPKDKPEMTVGHSYRVFHGYETAEFKIVKDGNQHTASFDFGSSQVLDRANDPSVNNNRTVPDRIPVPNDRQVRKPIQPSVNQQIKGSIKNR